MKNIHYVIALNMISVAVMAQTPVQPAERVQTPVTGTEYGEGKTEIATEGFRKNENALAEHPAQAQTEELSVPRPTKKNNVLLTKKPPAKANRAVSTRRPFPISFSIGALMLSANH
jgi:hypothetical protein